MSGNGLLLSGLDHSNAFLNVLGGDYRSQVGWTVKGTDDAVLAFDANSDGLVTPSEIVGLISGDALGFLASLDTNGDGILDGADAQFSKLMLWTDTNGNGAVDDGEVKLASDVGIVSISLEAIQGNFSGQVSTGTGNSITAGFTMHMTDGRTVNTYDALLDRSVVNTRYAGAVDPSAFMQAIFSGAGELAGGAEVPDLWTAMALDPNLVSFYSDLKGNGLDAETILAGSFTKANSFAERWADTQNISVGSRGEFVDAAKLHTMEKFFGLPYQQAGQSNPNSVAGMKLDSAWSAFSGELAASVMASGPAGAALGVFWDALEGRMMFTSRASTDGTPMDAQNMAVDSLSRLQAMASDALSVGGTRQEVQVLAAGLRMVGMAVDGDDTSASMAYDGAVSSMLSTLDMSAYAASLMNAQALNPGYYHRPGGDTLLVTSNAGNVMSVGQGNHLIFGGTGNDLFRPGAGQNIYDGGGGRNALTEDLNYVDSTVDMRGQDSGGAGTATLADGSKTIFSNVQDVTAARGTTTIWGDNQDNTLVAIGTGYSTSQVHGGGGDDLIYLYDNINTYLGHAPADAWGDDGNDILVGNEAVNHLDGGPGDDVLYGNGGDDVLVGGPGNDMLFGGWDYDTADYSGAAPISDSTGIYAEMALRFVDNRGIGGEVVDSWGCHDFLFGVERVIGTAAADFMGAGQDPMTFVGGLGSDVYAVRPWSGATTVIDTSLGGSGDVNVLQVQGMDQSAISMTRAGDDMLIAFQNGPTVTVTGQYAQSSNGTTYGLDRMDFIQSGTSIMLSHGI